MKQVASTALVALLLLTGCVNIPAFDRGDGTYRVVRNATWAWTRLETLRTEALQEAARTCRAQDKGVVVLEEEDTPYLVFSFARVDLTFRCE